MRETDRESKIESEALNYEAFELKKELKTENETERMRKIEF